MKLSELEKAKIILEEYAAKDSTVDSGNLYFAATVFEERAKAVMDEAEKVIMATLKATNDPGDGSTFSELYAALARWTKFKEGNDEPGQEVSTRA